jgi:hypothetical protein
MENNNQNYTGQTFQNRAVYINGEFATDPQVTIARSPYFLERYHFDKIISLQGYLYSIATTLLGATLGLFINLIAKLIGSKMDSSIKFDNWEIYAFLISLVLMGIFYGIDCLVPNERKRIIKEIRAHFEPNNNN